MGTLHNTWNKTTVKKFLHIKAIQTYSISMIEALKSKNENGVREFHNLSRAADSLNF